MSVRLRVTTLLVALVSSGSHLWCRTRQRFQGQRSGRRRWPHSSISTSRKTGKRGIVPAETTDDAEFVRRIYLDIIGRATESLEARDFIDDKTPGKRAKLVDFLLKMPGYSNYFASVTRQQWLPQAATNFQLVQFGIPVRGVAENAVPPENTPADKVVKKILTLKVNVNNQNPMFRFVQPNGGDADALNLVGFYQANEGRPENMGAAVSRLFLGVKLECAECHDHPFAPYTRDQFWQFAAFFAELNPLNGPRPGFIGPIQPQSDFNKISIPNTEKK